MKKICLLFILFPLFSFAFKQYDGFKFDEVDTIPLNATKTVKAKVISVYDGDTYHVRCNYMGKVKTIKVRLANVDCPEVYFIPKKRKAQPFADNVKNILSALLLNNTVELTYYVKNRYAKPVVDFYGRPIVFIKVGKERLDDIILRNGWGWYYDGYHKTKPYPKGKELMESAQKDSLGLWSDPNPIKPSDWRKGITEINKY